MFYAILLLIFCRPFISSLSFPVLNTVYSSLFLLFLIIWITLKRQTIQQSLPVKLKLPLMLFILSLIVSTSLSADKNHGFQELNHYLSGLLLFMVPFSLSPENKRRVLLTIILAGLCVSFLAIYQYFFGFKYILNYLAKEKAPPAGLIDYLSQRRAFLPFISPNALAGYLIMIIPLSLAFKKRIFFILPLGLALLLTKSLGALFSLLLGIMLYFYLNNQKSRRKITLLCALSTIIFLVFILRQNSDSQFSRPGFSLLMRWDYWKETLETIKLFPFLGVGLGNLDLSQARYAHNIFLQTWAEIGVFGIISFSWIIYKTYCLIKHDFPSKKEISGLVMAILAFLVHNLVDFTFFLPETSLIWWVILGIYFSSHVPETCARPGPEPVTLT